MSLGFVRLTDKLWTHGVRKMVYIMLICIYKQSSSEEIGCSLLALEESVLSILSLENFVQLMEQDAEVD